jgi:hypothetical protein
MRRLTSASDHRRRGAIAAMVALALAPLALLAGGWPSFAAGEQVTIIFRGDGPEPLVCTSYPEPTSVSIKVGTAVAVENRTGLAAVLSIGTAEPIPLPDGEGLTLKLKKGTHELRLEPSCLVVQAGAATVEVGTGSDLGEPVAPPGPGPEPTRSIGDPTPTASSVTPTETSASPAASEPAATAGPTSPAAVDVGSRDRAIGVDRPVVPGAPEAVPGAEMPADQSGPVLERVGPYPLPGRDHDDRGERLVAVIAAICVLGVTAGIIRAILAQQASGAART